MILDFEDEWSIVPARSNDDIASLSVSAEKE